MPCTVRQACWRSKNRGSTARLFAPAPLFLASPASRAQPGRAQTLPLLTAGPRSYTILDLLCSCRNKLGAELHIYLEEGTCHKRLFRGPSTNDMKKQDGPSLSWPTPHTTLFFLPPEDPYPVILRPNSTPQCDFSRPSHLEDLVHGLCRHELVGLVKDINSRAPGSRNGVPTLLVEYLVQSLFTSLFCVIDTGSTGSQGRTWGLPVYLSPLI